MVILEKRRNQILELCHYLTKEYNYILTNRELQVVEKITNFMRKINIIDINLINTITDILLPIVERVWEEELKNNTYIVVSWNKYSTDLPYTPITFATLSKKDKVVSFCELKEGTEYEIQYSSIIGCLNKDGATLIEDKTKENEYTIAKINDKVINSYNGATKLITPKQLVSTIGNKYKTNYNELILYSDLIKKIGPYKMEENNTIKKL